MKSAHVTATERGIHVDSKVKIVFKTGRQEKLIRSYKHKKQKFNAGSEVSMKTRHAETGDGQELMRSTFVVNLPEHLQVRQGPECSVFVLNIFLDMI